MEFKIRLATELDDHRLLEMLKEAHKEGPYKDTQAFSEDRALEVIRTIRRQGKEHGIILIAEEEKTKEIIGIFGAMVTFSSFSLDPLAAELLWWVHPKARKTRLSILLVDAYEMWAEKIGVTKLVIGSMENDHAEAIDRFYKKRGFTLTERTYCKELQNGRSN